MKQSQLKQIIREEYHKVSSFMEEKYGFTPELGKVMSNPYASSFKMDEDVEISKADMEKLHSDGSVEIDGETITFTNETTDEALSDYEKKGANYDKIYKKNKYTRKNRANLNKSKKNEGGESDSEMAVDQLDTSIRKAQELITKLQGKGDLEPWVQSLITKAEDYISTVADYGEVEEYDVESIEETKDFINFMKEYKSDINEAEYQGRKVELGKPMQGDVKKFKVYVNNDKGNTVKVNFGQKGMVIKKDNPAARKSFRARMNCDSPGPRWKANYWSCRKW
tara:strand:+ start:510 stop:1349 length:840 start_codon:yes stop_codon:yes gene_type:complete